MGKNQQRRKAAKESVKPIIEKKEVVKKDPNDLQAALEGKSSISINEIAKLAMHNKKVMNMVMQYRNNPEALKTQLSDPETLKKLGIVPKR